jgi:Cys-rich four helix bundle protein (predicted Tat secretion target)
MNRREMLKVGVGTAVAHGVVTAIGCGAQGSERHEHHAGGESTPLAAPTDAQRAFARAAAVCIAAGEVCLSHCLRSLQTGDTSMAECARTTRAMLAICHAVPAFAGSGSAHLGRLAALCADVCAECEASCAAHASHDEDCRACAEACRETQRQARALAA